jgi:phage/plasmid-like protein (TIGR03299 family)
MEVKPTRGRVDTQVVQKNDAGAVYGGTIIEGNVTVREALELSGLNWSVGLEPLLSPTLPSYDEATAETSPVLEAEVCLKTGNREVIPGLKARYIKSAERTSAGKFLNVPVGLVDVVPTQVVPGYYATMRQDNRAVLGVVKSRYNVMQNIQAFDWIDAILGQDGACISSAGALYGGRMTWICVDLGGFDVLPGDEIRKHILIVNSHDGTSNLVVQMLPFRLVCQNILNFHGLKSGSEELKVRHSKGMFKKLEVAKDTFIQAHRNFDNVAKIYQEFSNVIVTPQQQKDIIYNALSVPEGEVQAFFQSGQRAEEEGNYKSPQWVNQVVDIERAIEAGPGNEFGKGSIWSIYNGLTYYYDYLRHVRGESSKPDLVIESKISGYSAKMKAKSFISCYNALRMAA